MTLLSDRIIVTIQVWRCAYSNNRYKNIISYLVQTDVNKKSSTVFFIDNLEIIKVFKDKDKEEEVSVTDLIN